MWLRRLLSRHRGPQGGALDAIDFTGSDIERLSQVEPVCSWPQQYYAVTEMLIKLSDARDVLEVGVAYGFHAMRLLTTNPSINYTGVDPYVAGYDYSDSFSTDVAHIFGSEPQAAMDRLHEAVVARLNRNFHERSQVLRMDSLSAATRFPDQCFDLVFIDGNHQYESVLRDLHSWYPKLRSGGLLVGDDYAWPDVQKAVTTFSDRMGISVATIQNVKSAHPLFVMTV